MELLWGYKLGMGFYFSASQIPFSSYGYLMIFEKKFFLKIAMLLFND